eukprot:CAMPEP_0179479542 /NCGR_PEP_ID=MMETSP0799-20121207/57762_1 /TAXON_ID=46947 /ORGANISM="Geminigera cryophila, Strain CCMP2564" /LENGTH=59 /DNA_ID=CAMNT_0021291237 /DNA_START=579 /DNA_END=754 /DNA_ORIENTATION=-
MTRSTERNNLLSPEFLDFVLSLEDPRVKEDLIPGSLPVFPLLRIERDSCAANSAPVDSS